jgi:hypothetical protein
MMTTEGIMLANGADQKEEYSKSSYEYDDEEEEEGENVDAS